MPSFQRVYPDLEGGGWTIRRGVSSSQEETLRLMVAIDGAKIRVSAPSVDPDRVLSVELRERMKPQEFAADLARDVVVPLRLALDSRVSAQAVHDELAVGWAGVDQRNSGRRTDMALLVGVAVAGGVGAAALFMAYQAGKREGRSEAEAEQLRASAGTHGAQKSKVTTLAEIAPPLWVAELTTVTRRWLSAADATAILSVDATDAPMGVEARTPAAMVVVTLAADLR